MRLSISELKLLKETANGNKNIKNIASAIKKSASQIYRDLKMLEQKELLTKSRGMLEPVKSIHTNLLLQLLSKHPNLTEILADSGIEILTAILIQKTIPEISRETHIKKAMIYKKISQAKKASIIKKENKKITINEKIWPDLKEVLEELKKHEQTTDIRIPANSTIYHKTNQEIIFSSKEELNASLTCFSAYKQYGIKLLLPENYYVLPKKELTRKEVFRHSLYVAEKEPSIRNLTYAALFYIKFRKELAGIKNNLLNHLILVIKGQKIAGYPSLAEIKEKAEIYNIKVKA